MSQFQLILRSLRFHWRTHFAVMLGVVIGTAVIGGALIVGDSVRASLRQITLDRLGEVDEALMGQRFFTEALSQRLDETIDGTVAPALSMQAGISRESDDTFRTTGGVQLYGIDERLWSLLDTGNLEPPVDDEIVINSRVAEELGAAVGDEVQVALELPSLIPRQSLLGEREETSREIFLTVGAIIPDEVGASRFGINPAQQIPPVAFVPLELLQTELDLAEVQPSRRNPIAKPARVNSLFASDGNQPGRDSGSQGQSAELNKVLKRDLTLQDLNIRIRSHEDRGYYSVESERMILENGIGDAAARAASNLGWQTSPVMVYLVNEISNANNPEKYAAYSVVAGLEIPDKAPFGPFELLDGSLDQSNEEKSETQLSTVILNEFLANEQLGVSVGDEIIVKFFTVGTHGELPEEEHRFRVGGIVALDDTPAADAGLTPELEGITDADTFGDWEQPFEMDLDRVTDADESYWESHRATPKLFLPMPLAQELFQSRYGKITSFRVAPPTDADWEDAVKQFKKALLEEMDLDQLAMEFQPVKAQGLAAAAGTQDFTGLFIGFSFFLILSAAILIGLLFRLGVEQRTTELGLLGALGFTRGAVRRIFLMEGFLVVLFGSLIGVVAAIGYASIIIYGLKTWWIGAIGTRFLFVQVQPVSILIAFLSSLVLGQLAVLWGLWRYRSFSVSELLKGAREQGIKSTTRSKAWRRAQLVFWFCGVGALLLIAGSLIGVIPQQEVGGGITLDMLSFFLAGMLLLATSLALLSIMLGKGGPQTLEHAAELGMRNAGREKQRSLMTTSLVASATFVLVAVSAARMDPTEQKPRIDSGNGGFLLVAESTVPLQYDLNSAEGRDKLGMFLNDEEEALWSECKAIGFQRRAGDDASCLNLFRTQLPTILGASEAMIERGGFAFTATPSEKPWTLLNQELSLEDGIPTYPVMGDMNTLLYSLKKGVGDTIAVPDEDNPEYRLQIVGMFVGSVFQGTLVMSAENFRELYPDLGGDGYFLIEGPQDQITSISSLLEKKLSSYGFDAEPVATRLSDFLAVQNTYLSTFQALGGMGLLLGTFGLAIVMLRNVYERRGELALMRAIGFPNKRLAGLVVLENTLLLVWGLVSGTVAALLSLSPHLLSAGAELPVGSLALLLLTVLLVGTASSFAATLAAVRTPVIATLRGE
ncbi:FtsX-like permease family protein [Calycomorphotria hydatis]|uniref:FtsX-like permease family protein n=1 Tax=Calycomorphotria hydatis TaxID=2528027 RepID=A0A517T9J9_9PLAN|nr:ABC transporter permease [Calycomorphotria hydatis]QDT65054.1 FtsX-like permease family protein [Calycomorphotria hydatis]